MWASEFKQYFDEQRDVVLRENVFKRRTSNVRLGLRMHLDQEFRSENVLLGFVGEMLRRQKDRVQRPPLGLTPKYIWDGLRSVQIRQAVERYNAAGKDIPDEWVDELFQIHQVGPYAKEPA